MHLATIHVKNFRNLRDFTLKLRPGLTVILGENNIGKTNLLDAVRLALTTTYGGDSIRLSPEDLTRPGATNTIEVSLWFEQLTDDEQAEFLDLLNFQPPNTTASLHYKATYNAATERWSVHRWGGDRPNSDSGIPEDVLQSLPITILGALRDAASALQPGRFSRLARLLKTLAQHQDRSDVEAIIKTANDALEANTFITGIQTRIHNQSHQAIGPTLSQNTLIRTSEPDFDRIAQNLRLVIDSNPRRPPGTPINNDELEELKNNGLGYNNLLYVATVMTELHVARNATMPLLLVEEPEAHLHPQLQTRLADGLRQQPEAKKVQTIVTSHSPTIAAHVPLADLTIIHSTPTGTKATNLATLPVDDAERAQLRRLLDVTKATLFFARGLIIVEGITEALLLPVLTRRLGTNLEDRAISVIPLCGVEFTTIAKLFGPDRLQIPTSLVTDADPTVTNSEHWHTATPQIGTQAARVTNLDTACRDNPVLCVKKASVTFEYDLAVAGEHNAAIIARAWETTFAGNPINLTQARIEELPDAAARALHIWRAICVADNGKRKAVFAQALAELLNQKNPDGTYTIITDEFAVPTYLQEAITHALG
jgi:putative ATP-dependent endonuclease of OLD family